MSAHAAAPKSLKVDCKPSAGFAGDNVAFVKGELKTALIRPEDKNHKAGGTPGAYAAKGEISIKRQYDNNEVGETLNSGAELSDGEVVSVVIVTSSNRT